jgi:hypothetical protein
MFVGGCAAAGCCRGVSSIPKHCRLAGRKLTITAASWFARIAAIVGEFSMKPFLILARAAIIGWTTISVLPLEIAFDAVESELKRRGVEL